MGIALGDLNDKQRAMIPENERAPFGKAGLTTEEAVAKHWHRLERDEQKTLVAWLMLQEEAGKLTYDWSRTDKKSTSRMGLPDFRIYRGGRVLLGEMKMDGAKLSPDQEAMREKFLRAGTEVQIWSSADAGILATRNWLWTHWRLWPDELRKATNELSTA